LNKKKSESETGKNKSNKKECVSVLDVDEKLCFWLLAAPQRQLAAIIVLGRTHASHGVGEFADQIRRTGQEETMMHVTAAAMFAGGRKWEGRRCSR